ncbi:MAG: 4-(cytidine 5'-diphospho)-2-C-methyl-D-erythritol kinase [Rhodospirillales bacterium]|nr:4-(cytidine 5'-diphospho)-2-C-methyl-D-erythritol kinase [Rhodospirillales bacterium]
MDSSVKRTRPRTAEALDEPLSSCAFSWAWAKVNLYLHIIGRRDDGFHLLDSLVAFAGVGDRLHIRDADTLTLTVAGPFADSVPRDESNLVLRAAGLLADVARSRPRAHIHLEKNLPVASGIGGGSSDAAATLKHLNSFWDLGQVHGSLRDIAATLGADVPMCLDTRTMFVGGIGEEATAAPPMPPVWLVLANPGVPVLTADVYHRRTGPFSAPGRFGFDEPLADAAALARCLGSRGNDLTAAAVSVAPAITDVLAALAALPGALIARMSGSGGTCFAVFAERESAERAAARLAADHPQWWVVAAPLLGEQCDQAGSPHRLGSL